MVRTPAVSSVAKPKSAAIRFGKSAAQLTRFLLAIGQSLLQFAAGRAEIRIRKSEDSSGQTVWTVYDPSSEETVQFSAESEVRAWIEQRYYSNHK